MTIFLKSFHFIMNGIKNSLISFYREQWKRVGLILPKNLDWLSCAAVIWRSSSKCNSFIYLILMYILV